MLRSIVTSKLPDSVHSGTNSKFDWAVSTNLVTSNPATTDPDRRLVTSLPLISNVRQYTTHSIFMGLGPHLERVRALQLTFLLYLLIQLSHWDCSFLLFLWDSDDEL